MTFEKVINPKKARLRVVRQEPAIDMPIACRNCEKPPCVDVCPTDALSKSPKTGIVYVNEEKCIGCSACVEVCPFGAIFIHPDNGVAVKCTVCRQCVKFCPVECLKVVEPETIATEKQQAYVKKVKPSVLENLNIPEEGKNE